MSQEERVETLPSIIKSLAQQVVTRDAYFKKEQIRFEEEIASMRHQQNVMRAERDNALRAVEEVALERDRLKEQEDAARAKWVAEVERVRLQSQRELAQEKVLLARLKADFELGRADLTTKIGNLEQAATHHSAILVQVQREAEDWKSRYEAVSEELRHRTEEWLAQFSRIASSLEELVAARRNSDSDPSSPTVVPPYDSSPPKIYVKTDSLPKEMMQPRRIIHPSIDNSHQSLSKTVAAVRHLRPTRPQGASVLNFPNKKEATEKLGVLHAADPPSTPTPQRRSGGQAQGHVASCSRNPPVKLSSQSALPPDRVIITAHYEIKKEDDDEDAEPSFLDTHKRSRAFVSDVSHSREDDETEVREPVAKRRRTTTRKRSIGIVHDDGEENEVSDIDYDVRGIYEGGADDFDEMAIGAEDNHKEVYGHRRVSVREVRTSPHRPSRQVANHSGGSSSKKRKAGPAMAIANGRPVTTRTR